MAASAIATVVSASFLELRMPVVAIVVNALIPAASLIRFSTNRATAFFSA
jgi:hypothetical protein